MKYESTVDVIIDWDIIWHWPYEVLDIHCPTISNEVNQSNGKRCTASIAPVRFNPPAILMVRGIWKEAWIHKLWDGRMEEWQT